MSSPDFIVATYIVRTQTFDQAMQAASKRKLKLYEWEWHPAENFEGDVEQWYIYEKKAQQQGKANYLRGTGQLDENGLG
jgi:hypothetical protein